VGTSECIQDVSWCLFERQWESGTNDAPLKDQLSVEPRCSQLAQAEQAGVYVVLRGMVVPGRSRAARVLGKILGKSVYNNRCRLHQVRSSDMQGNSTYPNRGMRSFRIVYATLKSILASATRLERTQKSAKNSPPTEHLCSLPKSPSDSGS
jgi:hypothetical protein